MKTYIVGGAVRDRLLGLAVQDRDYVVVGSTPEQMIAAGFKPVGKDFPVFLHPKTHAEYALARTERKTAAGYKGFSFYTDPAVTLEQDLIRRDLSINAMAETPDGELIDPYGGQRDLALKLFRHVSQAFTEDPVRILRVARFAARFTDFTVAPETMDLMCSMVAAGEVSALVAERCWQELARGLMEEKPSRMFAVLRQCGALAVILPELDKLWGVPQPEKYHPEIDTGIHVMQVIDLSAQRQLPLPARFAALLHDLGKGCTDPRYWPSHHGHEQAGLPLIEQVCQRLRVPAECRDLALISAREHGLVGRAFELRSATIVELLARCDAWRKPQRFLSMLEVSACDHGSRAGQESAPFAQREYLSGALSAAQQVDSGKIAADYMAQPAAIPEAIRTARIAAIQQFKKSYLIT